MLHTTVRCAAPQHGDRMVTIDSMASLHPMYSISVVVGQRRNLLILILILSKMIWLMMLTIMKMMMAYGRGDIDKLVQLRQRY